MGLSRCATRRVVCGGVSGNPPSNGVASAVGEIAVASAGGIKRRFLGVEGWPSCGIVAVTGSGLRSNPRKLNVFRGCVLSSQSTSVGTGEGG